MKKIGWWFTKINGVKEREKVLSAFDNKCFSLGPITRELEEKFASTLKVPYVVMTNSGTSALTMALMASGVSSGDEVILPVLTWIATAQAAEILGAKTILVDCLPDIPLIDVSQVKKKITLKTKAIIPVHLNGRACDLDKLIKIGKENNITIIEDACKAMTSKTEKGYLGTIADIGCFSLGMMSLVSSGGYGGFVATKNEKLYNKLKLIRDHGVIRGADERYLLKGFNFKISDVLSAIGAAQLSHIKEKREHIDEVYRRYVEGLSLLNYLKIIKVSSNEASLMVDAQSKYREQIIEYLAQNNVEAERFHVPLHKAKYNESQEEFPNASKFSSEGFVLPCGPSQPLENVDRCIELLKKLDPRKQK